MDGSGISSLFETIYGPNSVKHILTGHAIARANRAHMLVESALIIQLQEMAMSSASENDQVDKQELENLYDNVTSKNVPHDAIDNPSLSRLKQSTEAMHRSLCEESRTARLWVQYVDYVSTARMFIRAARTGDWNLYLISINNILNLFAATGHIHYAKSARLHLQQMLKLETTSPWLYEKFAVEGLFVVRRSDRFWAGLWSDLTIEQVMMRSIKSRGGLTRGKGFTGSVSVLWIYSMHACASYHNELSSLTGVQHTTSDQHKELGKSRLTRDFNDLQQLMNWLRKHDPFDRNRVHLQSLDTGLIADKKINCDDAEKVGMLIQQSLDGMHISEATIKRSSQSLALFETFN